MSPLQVTTATEQIGGVVTERVDAATRGERRRALRALLMEPLLTAGGTRAAEFGLVRRHAIWLQEWLSRHPGWTLTVDSEVARLRKTPADLSDGSRPARDSKSKAPFSRRRYVLLCLALAALERSDRQTTLEHLAKAILSFFAEDPELAQAGVTFDLGGRDQRRDLVQAVRLLLDLRVLIKVQGEEQQYLDASGDVLYNISRPVLAAILNVRRGPSTIAEEDFDLRLAALTEEPLSDSAEGSNRRLRSRLTRRLLDDPLVYYEDLSEDELTYLHSQRPFLIRRIHRATGLHAEVRAEGLALVDERGDLSDLGLPEQGTDGHLTLLLAEYLAASKGTAAAVEVSRTALDRHTARLITKYGRHWRRDVAEPGAEVALTERVLDRLEALRLLRRIPDGVVPLAAIARFALVEPESRLPTTALLPGFEPQEES